ncbi:MAG: PAS domain S-box protein [Candidatus Thorarchaeota archaeon]|nr:PAS domain S-box protein [Candidatus Thorarchaeota archaeon]
MPIRILTVDDDADLLKMVNRFLREESERFNIISARSAQDALRLLEHEQIDAIVCDFHLGDNEMNGLELLEWLRQSGNSLPFIMFTGRSREEVAIKALNLGADFYLRKDPEDPVGLFKELAHHIQSSVDNRRMERALEASNSRFRQLFTSSLDGIAAFDFEGNLVDANPAFERITGYSRKELLGLNFKALSEQQWYSQLTETGENIQRTGAPRLLETALLRKNGSTISVSVNAWVMADDHGTPIGSWAIVRDTSARKLSETALEESETRFRSVFEESPIAIAIFDKDGNLTAANRQCLSMFGLASAENVIGYNFFQDPMLRKEVKEQLQSGRVATFDREYDFSEVAHERLYETERSGSVHLQVVAAPFGTSVTGDFSGFTFHMQEKSSPSDMGLLVLAATQQQMSVLFENTPVALAFHRIITDDENTPIDYTFLQVNAAFEEFTGLSRREIIGKTITQVLPGIKNSEFNWIEVYGKVALTQEPVQFQQYAEPLKRWYSVTAYSPMKGLFITAFTDITEQVGVYEELKKQKEELSDFAHHMKHELSNYLLKISGFLHLTHELQNDENFAKLPVLIEEMNQLLEHSAQLADAGLAIEKKETVRLSEIADEVANSHIPSSIEYIRTDLPEVVGDRTRILQVFSNIIDNAIVHGKPSRIELTNRKSQGQSLLEITNDGLEISPEVRSRIFDRGFTSKQGRLGYGLAIAKRIVEAHGWRLSLKATSPTTFVIEIPDN